MKASILILAAAFALPVLAQDNVQLIEGTFSPYGDPALPHPQKSKLVETIQGGVAVLEEGAGFYLMIRPLEPIRKTLYATVEYPNPADPAHPLINDAEMSPNFREYRLSSPEFIHGLEANTDYKVTVRIYENAMSRQPIDLLVQPIRSNVDTTGPRPRVVSGSSGSPAAAKERYPEPWKVQFDGDWRLASVSEAHETVSHYYVPSTEVESNWTRLITSQQGPRMRAKDLYDYFKKATTKDCPSLVVTPISETPDSIVFEWSCRDQPNQHELRRLASTPKGIFLLSYTKKAAKMSPEERKTWLTILEAALPPG